MHKTQIQNILIVLFIILFASCSGLTSNLSEQDPQNSTDGTTTELSPSSEGMGIPAPIAKAYKGTVDVLALSVVTDTAVDAVDLYAQDADVGEDDEVDDDSGVTLVGEDGAVTVTADDGSTVDLTTDVQVRVALVDDPDDYIVFYATSTGAIREPIPFSYLGQQLRVDLIVSEDIDDVDAGEPIDMIAVLAWISENGRQYFFEYEDSSGSNEGTTSYQLLGQTVYGDYLIAYKQDGTSYTSFLKDLHSGEEQDFVTSESVLTFPNYFPETDVLSVSYPERLIGISGDAKLMMQTKEKLIQLSDYQGDTKDAIAYGSSPSGLHFLSFAKNKKSVINYSTIADYAIDSQLYLVTELDDIVEGRAMIWIDEYNALSYTYLKPMLSDDPQKQEQMALLYEEVLGMNDGSPTVAQEIDSQYDAIWTCVNRSKHCSLVEYLSMSPFTQVNNQGVFGHYTKVEGNKVKVEPRILYVVKKKMLNPGTTSFVKSATEPYYAGNMLDTEMIPQIFIGSLDNALDEKEADSCLIQLTSSSLKKLAPSVSIDGLFIAYQVQSTDGTNKNNIQVMHVPTQQWFWVVTPETTDYEFYNPQFLGSSPGDHEGSEESEIYGLSFFFKDKSTGEVSVGTVNLEQHPIISDLIEQAKTITANGGKIPVFNDCQYDNVKEVNGTKME